MTMVWLAVIVLLVLISLLFVCQVTLFVHVGRLRATLDRDAIDNRIQPLVGSCHGVINDGVALLVDGTCLSCFEAADELRSVEVDGRRVLITDSPARFSEYTPHLEVLQPKQCLESIAAVDRPALLLFRSGKVVDLVLPNSRDSVGLILQEWGLTERAADAKAR